MPSWCHGGLSDHDNHSLVSPATSLRSLRGAATPVGWTETRRCRESERPPSAARFRGTAEVRRRRDACTRALSQWLSARSRRFRTVVAGFCRARVQWAMTCMTEMASVASEVRRPPRPERGCGAHSQLRARCRPRKPASRPRCGAGGGRPSSHVPGGDGPAHGARAAARPQGAIEARCISATLARSPTQAPFRSACLCTPHGRAPCCSRRPAEPLSLRRRRQRLVPWRARRLAPSRSSEP